MNDSDFSDLIPETIVVSPEAFDELERLLDKPAEANPKLKELLRSPTVFDKN